MVEDSEIQAFLKRLKDFTIEQTMVIRGLYHPEVYAKKDNYQTGVPTVLEEINVCQICRDVKTCKYNYPDLTRSEKHPLQIIECPHLREIGIPLPEEKCWICGQPNCDGYWDAVHIEYKHPEAGYLLCLPSCCIHNSIIEHMDEIKTYRTHINVPVHDNCLPEEEENEC